MLERHRSGGGETFVKRLIGLPGDRWREQNGFIYINGKKLDEPYVEADRRDAETIPEKTVPEGQYLMLGDNRASSCDSRRWGTVPRKNLVGPVFAIYWPSRSAHRLQSKAQAFASRSTHLALDKARRASLP